MRRKGAVALTHVLSTMDDMDKALETYQAMRTVRTARVQLNSRMIGEYIYHPDGAKAAVRNHVMGAMSAADWFAKLDWLYGSNGIEN